jgi:hypothetical protein
MTTLKALKRKLLANPDARAEYEALKLEERLAANKPVWARKAAVRRKKPLSDR